MTDQQHAAFTIEPATQEEIDLFCDEEGVVRPDPSDDRAVLSFASWFARWRHERRHGVGSW